MISPVIPIVAFAIMNAVLFWLMPRLTRPDLYFAVTVAPGFRDSSEGKSILRRYRTEVMLVSALALTAIVASVSGPSIRFAPGAYFLQLAASFAVFYRARRRVLPRAVPPTTIREAALHVRRRIVPGGWLAASGPFLLLAACAAYLRIHWEDIPARFAIHFGINGQPNRWADRSFTSVCFPLLSTAAVLAALTLILYGTDHWLRTVHAGGVQGARELKFRRTASAALLALEYLIALQSSWIALAPLRHSGLKARPPGGMVIGLLFLIVIVFLVVVLARLGQGGSGAEATNAGPSSTDSVPVGDRTQDRYWTLGVFYFNGDDPAVIVEKRFGLGYTLNFARPTSWIIVLLVLLGPLVAIVAAKLRG